MVFGKDFELFTSIYTLHSKEFSPFKGGKTLLNDSSHTKKRHWETEAIESLRRLESSITPHPLPAHSLLPDPSFPELHWASLAPLMKATLLR